MEAWAKILVGLMFLLVSLGYLYRPAVILRVNALGRSLIFNDSFVLLYRRRWGLLFFVCSTLFFYSGFNNLAYLRSREQPSTYIDLSEAYRAFRQHEYRQVVARCQTIVGREPDNLHAWELLGSAWSVLGHREKAARAWNEVLRLDPEHPIRNNPLMAQPAGEAAH